MEDMRTAEDYIRELEMEPHVEGGYFKECLRGEEDAGGRALWSSIYFLVRRDEISHLHRLQSDEVWYFHDGAPLTIYMISPEGELSAPKLGLDKGRGESPQIRVPKGYLFGAAMEEEGFSLVGCMVAPAFRYEEFELPGRTQLLNAYPQYREVILKMTRPEMDGGFGNS